MTLNTTTQVPFTQLHLHTPNGSLLDGFCRIDPMIQLAKSFGMDSIGVSDHGTVFAHFQFYKKMKEAGLHPVLGMEGYITSKKEWKKADFEKIQYSDITYRTKEEIEALADQGYIAFTSTKLKDTYKKDSFMFSKPMKPEHHQFLSELQNKEPLYATMKKSTRWYLSGKYDDRQKRLFEFAPKIAHLLMIAKNNEGYANLLALTTIGQTEGFYGKPRVDYHDIRKYGKGIIATSSCLGGTIPLLIRKGKYRVARNHIKFYQKCFDEFYLEIQPSTMPEQQLVNSVLMEWSKELNVPLVATSDAHMLRPEDRPVHRAITSINKNKEADESEQDVYEHCIFYSAEEMLALGMPAEALHNAYKIAHSCHVELDIGDVKYPEFEVPEGFDFDSYLRELSYQGLFERMYQGHLEGGTFFSLYHTYKERLDYELSVLSKKKISAYMLIVWDYINFARNKGILVGPGRGSAAGSLVAYLLGITNLDPIKYNLLFSRFTNPDRPGSPDIDSDFDYLRRHEVLDYVTNKYGADRVSQIITFGTLSTKSALKDIGRGLGIDHNEINEMNKHVPVEEGKPWGISKVLEHLPIFQVYQEKYPRLFELALEVEGMPRSQSTHACFNADSLVTTSEGLKCIADILIGDKVLTHNKRFKPVGEIMTTEANETFIIKTSASFPVEVTGNHPMYVREMNYKRLRKYKDGIDTRVKTFSEPKWKSVNELKVGKDYLGIPVNQESLIPDLSFELPFHSEAFWWIIGRYLGDGWTEKYDRTKRNSSWQEKRVIICCGKHKEELTEIEKKLKSLGFEYRVEEARTVYKIHLKVEGLYDYLQMYGRYAWGKKIPGHVINLPISLLKFFINGYFSADGYFLESERVQSFKTVSKELAIGMMQCVNKVFKRHCNIQVLPSKEEVIEGRTVLSKEKYNVLFTYDIRPKERSFYEDGYIWTRFHSIKINQLSKTMYNLTVFDDSSYVVHGLAAHNCGILISPVPITDSIALVRDKKKGDLVAGYDGPTIEEMGWLKFDFLGLKNLSVVEICRRLVEKRHGYLIDVDNLEPDDPKTFEMIRHGETDGVFQIESAGMRKLFQGMNRVDFETLIAGVALYRPGPMEYIPKYQALANGYDEIESLHPKYDMITRNTFGIMIYQEQVMEVSQIMAGYSAGEADTLRKAVGKKKKEILEPALEELYRRLVEHGTSVHVAKKICDDIRPFAGYAFNRSHAAAYSFLAYQSAYLKANYPLEFMTALLQVFYSDKDKVVRYARVAKGMGMDVLLPDINRSEAGFTIDGDNAIRYGLGAINGLGEATIQLILNERKTHFTNIEDLLHRVPKINKSSLTALTFSGAFDEFLTIVVNNRFELMGHIHTLRGEKLDDELTKNIEKYNERLKFEKERELLGSYVSGHVLSRYAEPTNWEELDDATHFTMVSLVEAKVIRTKKGQDMAFLKVDTLEGEQDLTLFPNKYEDIKEALVPGMILKVGIKGEMNWQRNEKGFIIHSITAPKKINKEIWDKIVKKESDDFMQGA